MTLVKFLIGTVLVFIFGNFGISGFRIIFFPSFRPIAFSGIDMDIEAETPLDDVSWIYMGGFLIAIGLIGVVLGIFLIRKTFKNAK